MPGGVADQGRTQTSLPAGLDQLPLDVVGLMKQIGKDGIPLPMTPVTIEDANMSLKLAGVLLQ